MPSAPRTFVYTLLVVLFLPTLATGQNMPMASIADKLRGIEIKSEDFPLNDVPSTALTLLPQWKRGIRQIIADVLSSPKAAGVAPAELRASLLSAFRNQGIALASDAPPYYGQLVRLEVSPVDRPSQLLAVTTAIDVGCGQDDSLDVFEKQQAGWRLALSYSADEYKRIDGAHENLEFRFSSLQSSQPWYLLIAHSPAWCTSCWSGLHYKVLRPGAIPEKPEVIYSGEGGFYRCADKPVSLQASPAGFSLGYPSMMTLDFDLLTKITVDRFSLTEAGVRRLPPLRQNAVDFVNQWSELPEKESTLLVVPNSVDNALVWHERLSHWLNSNDSDPPQTSFEYEQSCTSNGTRWQVKLTLRAPVKGAPDMPSAIYFLLRVTQEGIHLERVGTKEDSSCTGTRLRPKGADLRDLDLPESSGE